MRIYRIADFTIRTPRGRVLVGCYHMHRKWCPVVLIDFFLLHRNLDEDVVIVAVASNTPGCLMTD